MSKVFSIPAGIPFAKNLAGKLLEEYTQNPQNLIDILILLPTRRACRTVREAFLQQNAGKPMMLPTLQAIGDIDEEELSLSIAGQGGTQELLELPPVLPDIQRQILLARAIQKHEDFPHSFDQALTLAKNLSQLLDQIYTENLDIGDLANLVPEDFADHWQITLDFLKILSETWPQILAQMGKIDAADRRNRLINALADFWTQTQPTKRIIIAGTTGSIPSTAKLLNTVYSLPNGQIILPGLDNEIDDQSWENLSESHPQFGLKHLLGTLNINRESIKDWTDTKHTPRQKLASELMRPAETTKHWQDLHTQNLESATDNLKLFEADTQQDEAQIIASLMRETLEEPTKTAALITPDRNLAKRVSIACKRWNIELDDSAGLPLTQTPVGRFLILSAQTCLNALSPVSLLSVLKHPLTHPDFKTELGIFEAKLLRGIKPPKNIEGLYHKSKKEDCEGDLNPFIEKLDTVFSPLLEAFQKPEKQKFADLLQTHIMLCENLHKTDQIWAGEDGNAASNILSNLIDEAHHFPDLNAHEYTQILEQFLKAVSLRPAYGTHPRLQILGQLEARLIDADLVILGGLVEGTWPPDPGNDPWMSRPMRSEFGLPGSERSIGLAAHDFVQGLCAPNVAITRAKRIDGTPTIPARWLERLKTVLEAANLNDAPIKDHEISALIKAANESNALEPTMRPSPKPPLPSRPNKLSITKIETWLKDPYAIYAHAILKLRPLDPLEKESDAALRGELLHESLHKFVSTNPDQIPQNAANEILGYAQNFIESENLESEDWHFYWPRFEKITESFLEKEHNWRETAKPLKTEIKGEMTLPTKGGDFTLYGRADRIDQTPDGLAIIDYKSGGNFTQKGFANGNTPQLPLEGLIAENGGFENIPATPCNYLGYWVLNGAKKHTEKSDPNDILVDTKAAFITLIETFQDEDVPYYAIPNSNTLPRFNDYEHLARIKEWAALDDDSEAAA